MTTKQRLINLGLSPVRVHTHGGTFKGMSILKGWETIHGTLCAHVDYAIALCDLLESGSVLPNDVERCTGSGCNSRGNCKRYLATLIDCGAVPYGQPQQNKCLKMIEWEN